MMLRHLHLVVLFALLGLVFASDTPAHRLQARQLGIPIFDDLINAFTSVPSSPTTTTAAVASPTTLTTSSVRPTTTIAPIATTTSRPPTTTTTRAPTTISTTVAPQTTTTRLPTTTSEPPSTTSVQPEETTPISEAPSSSDVETTQTSVLAAETMTTVTSFAENSQAATATTSTSSTATSSASKPGLAPGYNNQTNTLSAESKKLIGGVVGGILGALLLAGVAFVFYKMWGRKRFDRMRAGGGDDDDASYFAAAGGSMSPESRDSLGKKEQQYGDGWGPSSLTSKDSEPLDRYKSPGHVAVSPIASSWGGKSPNAASNF